MVYAAADDMMMVVILQGARQDAGERGFTPLLVAAQRGHIEVCKLMLKTGEANMKETTPTCPTPPPAQSPF